MIEYPAIRQLIKNECGFPEDGSSKEAGFPGSPHSDATFVSRFVVTPLQRIKRVHPGLWKDEDEIFSQKLEDYSDYELFHLYGFHHRNRVHPAGPILIQEPSVDKIEWAEDGKPKTPPGAYLKAKVQGFPVVAYHEGHVARESVDASFDTSRVHYILPLGERWSVDTPPGVYALPRRILKTGLKGISTEKFSLVEVFKPVLNIIEENYGKLLASEENEIEGERHIEAILDIFNRYGKLGTPTALPARFEKARIEFYQAGSDVGMF